MITRRQRLGQLKALRERRLAQLQIALADAQARLAAAVQALRQAELTVQDLQHATAALAGALSSGAIDCALMESCLARIAQLDQARVRSIELLADAHRTEAVAEEDARQAMKVWARARVRLEAVTRWRLREIAATAAASERRAAADEPRGRGDAPWS